MEYIDGVTLHEAVVGGMTPEQAIPHLLKIGDALAHAHARGIIHRDVKPLNILIDILQRPYLTDFDLARVRDTSGGTNGAFGTIIYSAPELADEAQSADARADVYSLGMTAVFVLGGKTPSREVTRDEAKVIDALPYNSALRSVLKSAIAWRPEDRFANMNAFCRALASAWDGGGARVRDTP